MKEPTEAELKEFVDWFFPNFDRTEAPDSVIMTCMCGYFHISLIAARRQLKRCYVCNLLRRTQRKTVVPVKGVVRDPWWIRRDQIKAKKEKGETP